MKYFETIVMNNELTRQKFMSDVDRTFFVKNVNAYLNRDGLTSFWYDDYRDGKGTEGFRAEWVEDGVECRVNITLMNDEHTVNLIAID